MMLTAHHVERFARASGDVNPLHTDEEFAHRSPFGRPIAHGCLVVLAALAAAPPGSPPGAPPIRASFLRPVFPGTRYRVRWGADRVVVEHGGEPAVVIRFGGTPVAADPSAGGEPFPVGEPDLAELRSLVADLGANTFDDDVLSGLAVCSRIAGVHQPGRHGLLTSATLRTRRGTGATGGRLRVLSEDRRTGIVRVGAGWGSRSGWTTAEITAFRRRPAPAPSAASTAAHLPPGEALRGTHVVVTGGSRGFGAAMTAALATQGAVVWVLYARSDDAVAALRAEFGRDRVRPLRCDATDPHAVEQAVRVARREARTIAGAVLCATPPLLPNPVHVDAVLPAVGQLGRALTTSLLPLAALLPWLAADRGWLVFTSTAALDNPRTDWLHYTAGKVAAEHYVRHLASRHRLPLLVTRPPAMRTELTNGPATALAARAPEEVAADVTRWVLDHHAPPPDLSAGARP
ncbi:SDR family NAD(P)-dependent oxidoreductase [Saccharothrix variisporea]|uniref:MaoC dehydratase-like protein n=1 Tax=Saccharothrix variisporea TaxID=543527 RepID=A0A495XLA4_9PSEU|nr:SDR family NAD(P)-dependent oxidoreductase [Saccharothrix variisporea]RKT74429.1 MaoC dehydratase-like protein [Saccharothrix variisporea]